MRMLLLTTLLLFSSSGFAQSPASSEVEDVVKMFDALVPAFDVKAGDGLRSDLNCVFARRWDQSFHRDADGEPTEAFQPKQLLTIEQAIDPMGRNKDMFCDFTERDAQAQKLAIDQNKNVTAANIGFSYPDFAADHKTAVVYYQRWSLLFLANKKRLLPVGSNGVIKFTQHDGAWSFKTIHQGTVN